MWTFFAQQIDEGNLPKEWLKDWWAPHTISFGMMLGYPGVAIADGCRRQIGEISRENDMDFADIEISMSHKYDSADVTYAVDKKHLNHPEIKQHAKLWAETLEKVYSEFTDEKLMSVEGFREECEKFEPPDVN